MHYGRNQPSAGPLAAFLGVERLRGTLREGREEEEEEEAWSRKTVGGAGGWIEEGRMDEKSEGEPRGYEEEEEEVKRRMATVAHGKKELNTLDPKR